MNSSSNPRVLLELKQALLQENQVELPTRHSPWKAGATDGESPSPPVRAEDEVVIARVAQRTPSEQEQVRVMPPRRRSRGRSVDAVVVPYVTIRDRAVTSAHANCVSGGCEVYDGLIAVGTVTVIPRLP